MSRGFLVVWDDGEVIELRREIEHINEQLANVQRLREAADAETESKIAGLREQVVRAENEAYDDADELETLRRERDALQRTIRVLTTSAAPEVSRTSADPHDLPIPASVAEAVRLAQAHLSRVEVPDSALQDIDDLDATPKYKVWGSAVWQAFLAWTTTWPHGRATSLHPASTAGAGSRTLGHRRRSRWSSRTPFSATLAYEASVYSPCPMMSTDPAESTCSLT